MTKSPCGDAPTGRRFESIDEIYVFRVEDGKLASERGEVGLDDVGDLHRSLVSRSPRS